MTSPNFGLVATEDRTGCGNRQVRLSESIKTRLAPALATVEVPLQLACLGIPLISAHFSRERTGQNITIPHAMAALTIRGNGRRTAKVAHRQFETIVSPGMLGICEAGYEVSQGRYEGSSGEVLSIVFPDEVVDRLAHHEGPRFRLRTRLSTFDERASWLMEAIWNETASPHPNRLYAEGLMVALVSLLKQSYGWQGPDNDAGKFSPSMRRAVIDLIEAELGHSLSIETLANEVGLSVQHFSRVFKKTFGRPPHAYVVSRRIAIARRLLREKPDLSMLEIAVTLGFASQAHFARCFREVVGVTPTKWRHS